MVPRSVLQRAQSAPSAPTAAPVTNRSATILPESRFFEARRATRQVTLHGPRVSKNSGEAPLPFRINSNFSHALNHARELALFSVKR